MLNFNGNAVRHDTLCALQGEAGVGLSKEPDVVGYVLWEERLTMPCVPGTGQTK